MTATAALNLTSTDLAAHEALGITADMLARAHVRRVDDYDARERLTSKHPGDLSGILYSYLCPTNGHAWTYRLRRDHPEIENGKSKDKYMSAWGDRKRLYFPPDSAALLGDVAVDLVIVEAEKSVLSIMCAAEHVGRSVLAVATGGCWGWRGRIGKGEDANGGRVDETGVLPDFDFVTWTGRQVVIAFDANAATNEKVRAARRMLAKELTGRGAVVRIVDVPAGPGVNGPDDYIGTHGAEAFFALVKQADADTAPCGIVIQGGQLTEIVDRAQAALLTGSTIYQRGGLLTRAIKLDTATGDAKDVRREAGSTMLIAVREPWLIEQMAQTLKWFRYREATTKSKEKYSPADPPAIYARTLLGRGEWPFPVLRGVVTAPTLARDGRTIETPGFDAASGLLLDFPANSFPPVPTSPSKEEAHLALARLSYPLRGFPFVNEAAKSVALSALLTTLVRVSMRTAPMHGFDAPTAGTGKSLLAEMAGLLAMGFRPPALSQGKTAEEDEKRLATVLFAGDPVIHIDNCEQPISGDFLCSMLTQEVVQARILGLSERRVLPSTALVLASGNNLTFAGDTSRRAVVCRLDANVERPDAREFDFDCHAEVLAARPELVVAGLTILRAYHLAGRPSKLTPMGSFTDWEWIRGVLVWLDHTDPADTRSIILDNDPEKEELLDVMDLWLAACGTAPTSVADINTRAEKTPAEREPLPLADIALRNRLTEVACRGKWSAKSVGWWLRRHKDRVVGNRCFRMGQHKGRNGQEWRLDASDATPVQVLLKPEF